jgi:hypothetical protein
MSQFNQQFIASIIDRYRLELDEYHLDSIVATWIREYDRAWIVKAIVESLHRGRYKIKSVDSILSGWQRTGKPSYNFPPEFEREILQDMPMIDDLAETQPSSTLLRLDDPDPEIQFPGLSSEQLNPEESAPFPHHDCCRSDASPFSFRRRYANRKASAKAEALPTPTTRRLPSSGVRQDRRATPFYSQTLKSGTIFPQADVVGECLQDDCLCNSMPLSMAGFKNEDDVKLNHTNPHPKFQLFHTLRAIITPNNLQSATPDELDPPSYSTDLA